MDDPADEDDDYSDDDLDALPAHTFHELQCDAIQSTQQPSLSAQVQLPTINQPVGLTSGLGRLSVDGPASHASNQSAFQAPSSDYGDFDEDMLDGEIFDAAEEPALAARYNAGARGKEPGDFSQREQWRLQRYGVNQRDPGPIETQQHVDHQGAVGKPLKNGDYSKVSDTTSQGGRSTYVVNEKFTDPPPKEIADVNVLQGQVQKVGLLKAAFVHACLLRHLFSC